MVSVPLRTLAEYRQAIAAGLERLDSAELESLIVRHFPELDHTHSAPLNRNTILAAPLRVLTIWNEVNAFLVSRKMLPISGESPPEDLDNRSGRNAIPEEVQSRSGRIVLPEVSSGSLEITYHSGPASTRSYSEPTLEQPILQGITGGQPGVRSQTSRHILIGFLVVWFSVVTLAAVHICPAIKYIGRQRPTPLLSVATPAPSTPELAVVNLTAAPAEVPASPTPAPLPVPVVRTAEPAPVTAVAEIGPEKSAKSHHHHRLREEASYDRFAYDSGHDCQFAVPSAESGLVNDKPVITKIYLPRTFTPGSRAAKDWLQAKCKRIRRDTLHHR